MSHTSAVLSASARPRLRARLAGRARAHPAPAAAAIALAIAWGGLTLTHAQTPLAVQRSVAVAHALANRQVARMLAAVRPNRIELTPLDDRHEVLGFYRGARIVATVTVGYDGRVVILDATELAHNSYQYGSAVANDARVLALLCAVFVLMSGVWPLWRVRNLDVLATAGLTLSVVLFNHGLLAGMALISYPALGYLALRCAWWGLGPRRPPRVSVPLYDRLTGGWTEEQRARTLRLIALAAGGVIAVVGLGSTGVLDAGYAVMEGATLIAHGVLPYGHISDVLHGDTYPVGSYLLYVPFALLSPVHNAWDGANLTLAVAVAAALAAAAGLWRLAGRPARPRTVPGAAGAGLRTAGLRTAIAWMTFPPLLVTVSTGTTDVALAAMLVAAMLLWRRPACSAATLSAAAWFKLAPVAILPLALARLRGRALARAMAAIAITSAVMIAVLVALGGPRGPLEMAHAIAFQLTRGSQYSLWTVIGRAAGVQQLAQAATVALIVAATVRIRRDRSLAEDPARLAGITGAVMIGLQLSASYWSFLYLVWAFPPIAMSLLAPLPVDSLSGDGRLLSAGGRSLAVDRRSPATGGSAAAPSRPAAVPVQRTASAPARRCPGVQ